MGDVETALLRLVLESWRFSKVFERAAGEMDPAKAKRYLGRLDWYTRQLEVALGVLGCHVAELAGLEYSEGLPLTALNMEEFTADDRLVVDYMLEPTIVREGGDIVHTGTAMLRRAN